MLFRSAVNLIDGIDGLAAGVGLFASSTVLISALLADNPTLAIATAPVAAAILGFLRYNFNPATIFLGDSGSLLIGFLLGTYGILWSQKSATILGMTAPLMALAIPLLDTALTIIRRFLGHKPIFGADRGHIHHRLLDRGMTPRKAALMLYGFCGIGAVCSLLVSNSGPLQGNASGIVIIAFCLVTWIGIQHLGYVEFGTAGRMFVEGAFRRQLASQVHLQAFQKALASSEGPEQTWEAVKKFSGEFGFHRVKLRIAGKQWEHRAQVEPSTHWVMTVPLGGGDMAEFARGFDLPANSTVMAAFADEVRRSLSLKREVFANSAKLPLASGF